MSRTAFLFSGQGDQYPGMGRELAERFPAAAEVFRICDSIRPGTSKQCFFGTVEELKETGNTQPCLFAVEMAMAEVLKMLGVRADAAAGFSLGEVAAATYSGIFDLNEGFRLVIRRGELMQAEAEKYDTGMAAVVKLSAGEVEEICSAFSAVYPVNYNSPGQTTVAGLAAELQEFSCRVKAAGGKSIPVKVAGAFHSPFMERAAGAFYEELRRADLKKPRIMIYSDLTGRPYEGEYARILSDQIRSPVLWEKLVRAMIADGVDTFIEIGPGKTLTNLMKRIDSGVRALTFLEALSEAVNEREDHT